MGNFGGIGWCIDIDSVFDKFPYGGNWLLVTIPPIFSNIPSFPEYSKLVSFIPEFMVGSGFWTWNPELKMHDLCNKIIVLFQASNPCFNFQPFTNVLHWNWGFLLRTMVEQFMSVFVVQTKNKNPTGCGLALIVASNKRHCRCHFLTWFRKFWSEHKTWYSHFHLSNLFNVEFVATKEN